MTIIVIVRRPAEGRRVSGQRSLYTYAYVCVYIYIYIYTCISLSLYLSLSLSLSLSIYIYIYIYIHIHVCVYIYIYIKCVCVYIYIYIYIYTHRYYVYCACPPAWFGCPARAPEGRRPHPCRPRASGLGRRHRSCDTCSILSANSVRCAFPFRACEKQPKTDPSLFQRGVEHGKY